MHPSTETPLPKTLQVCQDVKFHTKFLAREKSIGSSSRVYYTGISSSIPFTWETQPGTPRKLEVPIHQNVLVLTPYQTCGISSSKASSKSRLLKSFFSLKNSKDEESNNGFIQRSLTLEDYLSSYSSSFSSKRKSRISSYYGSGSVSSFDEKVEVNNVEEILAARKTGSCFGRKGHEGEVAKRSLWFCGI